jgi:hypothetical protein
MASLDKITNAMVASAAEQEHSSTMLLSSHAG